MASPPLSPSSHFFAKHVDALILALASSTDNLTVGFSIGIRRKHLGRWANALISLCNGLGAFLAVFGGRVLMEILPSFANIVAAFVFGVLGVVELVSSYSNNETSSSVATMMTFSQVMQLAVPMTLNNLAGGAAGGAIGLSPAISGLYAVAASYVMMYVGHAVGFRLSTTKLPFDPSLVSGILLLALCLLTILDALDSEGGD